MSDKKGLEAIVETNTVTGNRLNNAINNQQNNRRSGYSYMLDNIRGTLTDNLYDKQCALDDKIKEVYTKRNEIYGNMITALTARYYSEKLISTQSRLTNMKSIAASLNISNRNDSALEKALTGVQSICTIESGKVQTSVQGYIDNLHSYGNVFYDNFSSMKSALRYNELDVSSNGTITGTDNMYIIKDDDIAINVTFKSRDTALTAADIIYYHDSEKYNKNSVTADVTIVSNKEMIIEDGTEKDPYLIYSYTDVEKYGMSSTSTDSSTYFKLMKDLTVDKQCDNICGTIDLNGHNMTMLGRNLTLRNANIKNNSNNSGGHFIIANSYSFSNTARSNLKLVATIIDSTVTINNYCSAPLVLTIGDSSCSVNGCHLKFKTKVFTNDLNDSSSSTVFRIEYETGTGTATSKMYNYNAKSDGLLELSNDINNISYFTVNNIYEDGSIITSTNESTDITNKTIVVGEQICQLTDCYVYYDKSKYAVRYTYSNTSYTIFSYTTSGSATINKSDDLYTLWPISISSNSTSESDKSVYNIYKSFSKQGTSSGTLTKLNISDDSALNSTGQYFRILILLAKLSTCNKSLVLTNLKDTSNNAYESFDDLYKLCIKVSSLVDSVSDALEDDISDYTSYLNDYINSYSAVEAYREANDENYSTTYTENLSTIFQQVQSQYALLNNEELSSSNIDISSIASESEFNTYLEVFQHESLILITAFTSSILSLTKYIEEYTLFFGSDDSYADGLEETIKVFNKGFTTDSSSSTYVFRHNSGIRNYEGWKDILSVYTNDGVYGLVQLYVAQELGINMLALSLDDNSDENILFTMLVNDVITRMYKKNLFTFTISKADEFSYEKALNNTYNIYVSETAEYEITPSTITDVIPDAVQLNNLDISSILLNIDDPINTNIGTYLDLIIIKYIFKDKTSENILSRIDTLNTAMDSSHKNFKVLLLRYHFYKVMRELKETLNSDDDAEITFDNNSIILSCGADDMFTSAKELLSKYIAVWLFKYYSEYSDRSALLYLGNNTLIKYLYHSDNEQTLANLAEEVNTTKTWWENIKEKAVGLWNNIVDFIF